MDGDGYENVTSKVNSRSFKFYRAYFIYVNWSNVGSFFLEYQLNSKKLYRSSGKERKS